jgi:hypothetical protein
MRAGTSFTSGRQPSEPESPAAAITDWPWRAISSKSWASMRMTAAPASGSQPPQELLTTWARSCWAMAP